MHIHKRIALPIGLIAFCFAALAQTKLTLEQAQKTAIEHHPRLGSSTLLAKAAEEVITQAKSAYYPQAVANATATAADDLSTLGAGLLQTSSLNTRFGGGVNVSQLVTDFNRTAKLVNAAKFRYKAASDSALNVRAQILLTVTNAYYNVLAAESVLRASQAALDSQNVLLRQIDALTKSELRSTLDLTFTQLLVAQAQLARDQAAADEQASRATLAAAMGSEAIDNFVLEEPATLEPLVSDLQSLVDSAMNDRPDISALKNNRDAAYSLERAERKLSYPTISLMATGGVIPEHDHTVVKDHYEAAGVNISIPVFNGGLFAARHAEALLKAKAADADVQDFSVQVARDVRTAWYRAENSFRRVALTAQIVEQARRAARLAQARYNAGLGSIVELNQAQSAEITAEISAAGAKYDYLGRRTELNFTTGALR